MKNKRGQIRVIEAFFASILILSSLTLIPAIQNHPSNSEGSLSETAFNVLASLDSDGHLASLVDHKDWSTLRNLIQSYVSPMLWFNVTVFDEHMAPLNDAKLCSGSPIGGHIEAVDYLCASTSGNYAIYTVRLQLGGLN